MLKSIRKIIEYIDSWVETILIMSDKKLMGQLKQAQIERQAGEGISEAERIVFKPNRPGRSRFKRTI